MPSGMPLGSEGGREGHPLVQLNAPSSQDAGPMVGNYYGVLYKQGSALSEAHSFIHAMWRAACWRCSVHMPAVVYFCLQQPLYNSCFFG